jgi:putative transposase
MGDVRRINADRVEQAAVTLDSLAREGARRMIVAALEAEVQEYLAGLAGEVDDAGKRLVVRNGRARERGLTVGSGTVRLRAPRVNDKRVDEETGERRRFTSRILLAYARRSPKVTDVLPVLYLHGLSTGRFRARVARSSRRRRGGALGELDPALDRVLAGRARGLPGAQPAFHRYAYLFIDGLHVSVRLGEDDSVCLLDVIGVLEDGCMEAPRRRVRLPRVNRVVGRRPARSPRPRYEHAEARDRRRRPRRVGGATRRLPAGQGAALLGFMRRFGS